MNQANLFGTDGIRAHISSNILHQACVEKLGVALGRLVKQGTVGNHTSQQTIVIGTDTRASGPLLQHHLMAGITSVQVTCETVGVVPTAAVAFLTQKKSAAMGVMISASHNPYHDNGFKIFGPDGLKIPERLELAIERSFYDTETIDEIALKPKLLKHDPQALEAYTAMIMNPWDFGAMNALRVVVDCAHGSASAVANHIFSHLPGVTIIANSPNGENINAHVGSEYPEALAREVLTQKAHLGIAFDGDADRVIFVDERGLAIDGDAILALMAIELKKRGQLHKDTMVATIMSSMALDRALAPHGIKVLRSDVGDKQVAQLLLDNGLHFGGENSGHIMNFPHSTTGDGMHGALWILSILAKERVPASTLFGFFQSAPRLLTNINVSHKIPLASLPKTTYAINRFTHELKGLGRVMLRYSGTEMKARLLVESESHETCQKIADEIIFQFHDELTKIK